MNRISTTTYVFNFYIKRYFKVCSNNVLENDLATIRSIAVENGFPILIINKLINSVQNHTKEPKFTPSHTKYCKMIYIPGQFEKLSHAFFSFGVNRIDTPPSY